MAVSGLAPPAPPTAPTNMVAFESSGAPALRFYRLDTSPYAEVQPIAGYTESSCNAFAYSSELNHFVAERSTGLSVYDTTTWPFTKLQDLAFYASQSNTARAAYSPDGRLLAITLSGNNNQALYSTDGYPAPQLFASGTAGALAFSHDSAFLAIGYNSAPYVRLFDVTSLTATSLPTLPSQPSSYVRALAFHPSVPIVAAAVGSDGVGLWDVGAGTYIGARTFGSLQVQAVALNPAANRMAIGLYSGSGSAALLKVLDCTDFLNPASWTEIAVTDPPAGASWIYDLAWSPGGDILAVKSRAGPAYSLAFDTTAEPYVKVPSFDVVNTDSGDRVGFLNAAAMPPP